MHRIGELLSRNATITAHDVQEILAEQVSTRRPFGQIALQWGLCQPEDLWRAWFTQLGHRTPQVKLSKIGVDSRVLELVPKHLADRYRAMPLRIFENQIVFAVDRKPDPAIATELGTQLGHEVKFVLAESNEIEDALRTYYLAA